MNNHHEYTIYEASSRFYKTDWATSDLARQVTSSVAAPFQVLMTAYGEQGSTLMRTTVDVSAVEETLFTWFDSSLQELIYRITYQISPHQMDCWVDVSQHLATTTIPQGVVYCWARESASNPNVLIGSNWCYDLDGYLKGKFREIKGRPFFVHIPSTWDSISPLPKLRGVFRKPDQKSSSETVSGVSKAEVQSDIDHSTLKNIIRTAINGTFGKLEIPRFHRLTPLEFFDPVGHRKEHLTEADLRELGVPSFLFKGKADPERPATDTPSNP